MANRYKSKWSRWSSAEPTTNSLRTWCFLAALIRSQSLTEAVVSDPPEQPVHGKQQRHTRIEIVWHHLNAGFLVRLQEHNLHFSALCSGLVHVDVICERETVGMAELA
jgi:hypothetical protein